MEEEIIERIEKKLERKADYDTGVWLAQTDIENLIKKYRELEKENKELKKYYATRKEVEDLKEINSCLHESEKDYIPKSKIKEKIEELKERPNKMVIDKGIPEEYKNIFLDERAIKILQELLEEE